MAGCVLIRALEPLAGFATMRRRRPAAKRVEDLASGPGKLTLAMGITRKLNGADLVKGPLQVRRPLDESPVEIQVTPRIGITHCADWPLRFLIAGNRFASR
jgi:DNA-3-methyladenine glycosylase